MSTCPRCGASNPSENKFCGQCGQLLIPESPPAEQNDLPAWLRDQTAATQPIATGAAPAAQSSEQLPAWLTDMGVDDAAADGPPPSWLAELQQPAATTSSPATTQELPDWLRDLEPELAASTSPATRDPSPGNSLPTADVPAWLQEMETTSASQPTLTTTPDNTEPLPDWISQSAPTTPAAADDLPAWLRSDEPVMQSLRRDEPAPSDPQVGDQIPAWLSARDETEETRSQNAIPETPAWLSADQDDATRSGSQNAIEQPPAWLTANDQHAAQADVDLPVPDWNNELGTAAPSNDRAQADALPAWLRDDAAPTPATTSDNLPPVTNWLDDVSADQAGGAAQTQVNANTGDDLPPWLSETTPAAGPLSTQDETAPSWLAETNGDQPATTAETTELPAWLRDDDQPAAPVAAAPADELPSWLTESSDPPSMSGGDADTAPSWLTDATATPATPTDPGATQALPSWLIDEPASSKAAPATPDNADALPSWLQPTDEPAPPGNSGIPTWLALPDEPQADQHAAQVYDAPEDQAQTSGNLPAWLTSDPAATEEPRAAAPSSTTALPAWLDAPADEPRDSGARVYDVRPVEAAETPAAASTGSETVQLPAWLADESSTPATTPSSEITLPSWLDGIADEPAPTVQASTSALPAWLDQPDEPKPTAAPATSQSELLGGLELPAWLRDDRETPRPAPAQQDAPAWLERIEPEAATASALATVETPTTPRIARTPERREAMTLLDQLMTSPPAEPAPAVPVGRRSRLVPILLALIALALIAAVAFVLLSPRLPLSFGAAPVVPASGAQVVDAINRLPANRPVVLAYEWDAQRIGELRPLEDAIVGQLTSRTDVPLVFVSTDPQGALLAGERAAQVRAVADRFHDQYGLGVVNLGFKAGGALAVRRYAENGAFGDLFARDVYGNDLRANDVTMQSICGTATAAGCSWDNVGLLVVMADDVDDVRGWFEQLRSARPNLQTLVVTPAEIGPQVQPYTSLPNVLSLSGLDAAFAYTAARGLDTERIGRQLDATAIGTGLWGIVMLVGAIPALIAGRRARREAENDAWER